jgi:hypothetical protein
MKSNKKKKQKPSAVLSYEYLTNFESFRTGIFRDTNRVSGNIQNL